MDTKPLKPLVGRALKSERVAEAALARRVGRYPYFSRMDGPTSGRTLIEGREMLNFGSNNYLGLAGDPRVIDAAVEATRKWGTGATGSRLLNGNLALHEELERALADFFCREAALVFPTGYTANLGALSALFRPGDRVVVDDEVHASVIDGLRLSRASLRWFDHQCFDHFEEVIAREGGRPTACVIEGTYSMRGDIAAVGRFAHRCADSGVLLVVDEAHSLGTIGARGAGVAERDDVLDTVDLITVTFSKSLGSCGGAVIGDAALLDALRLVSRPFLFTASNTPASLGAALAALQILDAEPTMVAGVRARADFLRDEFVARGVAVNAGDSPIVTVPTGSDFSTMQACRMAWNRGLFCNPVISPAVPRGDGLLRFSVTLAHDHTDIVEAADIVAASLGLVGANPWDLPGPPPIAATTKGPL